MIVSSFIPPFAKCWLSSSDAPETEDTAVSPLNETAPAFSFREPRVKLGMRTEQGERREKEIGVGDVVRPCFRCAAWRGLGEKTMQKPGPVGGGGQTVWAPDVRPQAWRWGVLREQPGMEHRYSRVL